MLQVAEIDRKLVDSFIDAAKYGDVSKFVDMVEAGMPVDVVDEDDWTALMNAANDNRTDVECYLLEKGENVDKQDRCGKRALHSGSLNAGTDVIRMSSWSSHLNKGTEGVKEQKTNTQVKKKYKMIPAPCPPTHTLI